MFIHATVLVYTLPLQGSQYWLGSDSANQEFFKELLSTARVSTNRIYTFPAVYLLMMILFRLWLSVEVVALR